MSHDLKCVLDQKISTKCIRIMQDIKVHPAVLVHAGMAIALDTISITCMFLTMMYISYAVVKGCLQKNFQPVRRSTAEQEVSREDTHQCFEEVIVGKKEHESSKLQVNYCALR